MKKILFLLPLLLIMLACLAQPLAARNAPDPASATLTAIARSSPQAPGPQIILATAILSPTAPVPSLPPASGVSVPCSASWFFTFDDKHLPLAAFCPEPVRLMDAVGQDFEGGRVYRYAPDTTNAAAPDQRGTVWVIYNDGEWVTFPDGWDASQPSSDPNILPPSGRYQPVDSIGKVWRENADVRARLGWAYEPQSSFQGRMQLYAVQPGLPGGDTHFIFIDHGKWGIVLLLNSVDMGPNKWELVGNY
jgi:hypothetical protein